MSEGVRVHGRCYGGEADWRGEGAGGEGVEGTNGRDWLGLILNANCRKLTVNDTRNYRTVRLKDAESVTSQ